MRGGTDERNREKLLHEAKAMFRERKRIEQGIRYSESK